MRNLLDRLLPRPPRRMAPRVLLPVPQDVRDCSGLPADEEVIRAVRSVPPHFASFGTNTWPETFFSSNAAFSAVLNSTSETTLLGGTNLQPTLSPPTFAAVPGSNARALTFKGCGILSTTGTPTLTFKFYLNTTQGSSSLAGTALASSAAITTASGAANTAFRFELNVTVRTPGQGTGHCTITCDGWVESFAGFASPFRYTLSPGGGDSATVTATLDGSLTQFFNASATWGTASNSNTITLEQLTAVGWN